MSDQVLQRAHRLYALRGDYVAGLIEADPNHADLILGLEATIEQLGRRVGRDEAAQLAQALTLVLEITREHAFKLGYVLANTDDEVGEV